jgi:Flp pilus assembly protein TadD
MATLLATRRRSRRLIYLGALLVLGTGLGAYAWLRSRPAAPPEIPLEGLESEVAEAIEKARAAVLADPRSGAAWGGLGRVLLANDEHPDIALACFEQAERLEPEEPRWPYFCAVLLIGRDGREEAVAKLTRAVDLSEQEGGYATPRLLRAETLAYLGQAEQAESDFRQVLTGEPHNPRAHFGLGMLAYARGQWKACRRHLEACLGTGEARKKVRAQLAAVCQRLGDRPNADRYAAEAARLPKDFGWLDPFAAEHMQLARRKRFQYRAVEQLEAAGRLAQAAEIVSNLLRRYPDEDLPHLLMGRLLAQAGQLDLAEQHVRSALQLAPHKFQGHYVLGLVLFKRGEALEQRGGRVSPQARALFEESVRACRKALAGRPDYGFAHMALGVSLMHLGRKAEAIAAFREAVHCNPEYADNHLHLGIALAREGHGAEARRYLDQARLLAGPNDPRPAAALQHYFPGAAHEAPSPSAP